MVYGVFAIAFSVVSIWAASTARGTDERVFLAILGSMTLLLAAMSIWHLLKSHRLDINFDEERVVHTCFFLGGSKKTVAQLRETTLEPVRLAWLNANGRLQWGLVVRLGEHNRAFLLCAGTSAGEIGKYLFEEVPVRLQARLSYDARILVLMYRINFELV